LKFQAIAENSKKSYSFAASCRGKFVNLAFELGTIVKQTHGQKKVDNCHTESDVHNEMQILSNLNVDCSTFLKHKVAGNVSWRRKRWRTMDHV